MEIADLMLPVNLDELNLPENKKGLMCSVIETYSQEGVLPDKTFAHLAIIGVTENRGAENNKGCEEAPDEIRKKLYTLKTFGHAYKIIDLGNIRMGETQQDTYAALTVVMVDLMRNNILPIIIGGSQDLTFAMYAAYQKLEQTVNIVTIDSHFDLGSTEEKINNKSFVGKIVLQEPNFLFNLSNIGYQSYFAGSDSIELMDKLYFDVYSLGQVRKDMEDSEPIIRNADIVSFDISAIRQSDAPGNGNASPNGFFGDEACQLARYAGISDKLSSFGIFEVNPLFDYHGQTAHLASQMIWYFIEGFYQRKKELPVPSKTGFIKYNVNMNVAEKELVFYKSKRSERWWMEVPYTNDKMRYHRQQFIPCSYKDYQTAMQDEMPERWWQAFQKLG